MNYVTRAQWGARPARSTTDLRHVDTVVFHYTAADADEQRDHANCANRVRGIQNFHMDSRGWNDIAYNFLVCSHGYVFEGRGYWNWSAATGNDNSHTIAVCALGNDDVGEAELTPAMRQAFVAVTKEIQRRWRKQLLYKGHRDFMSTVCPGNEIYGYIRSPQFSAAVNNDRLPGPVPKPAWFWAWADWRLGGRQGPRPAGAPRMIPLWAWQALREWQRRH